MKNNRLLYLLIIILVIWNIILTTLLVNKKEDKPINQTSVIETNVTGFSTDLTKVVEQTKSSVVIVETNGTISSGFIYSTNENKVYIISSYHAVADASFIKVMFASGASYDATLLGKDIYSDVAVLELDANFEVLPISLGDSSLIKDGEFMICVGTPKATQYAFSKELALVSSSLKTISNSITSDDATYDYYMSVIQLNADVSDGYSGSPLFNMNGELVGMITMRDDAAVFALPVNELKIVADKLIAEGECNKIQLGFKGSFVSELETYEKNQLNIPLDINDGCYISGVKANSLANNIGLKVGDILMSINDVTLNSHDDLLAVEYTDATSFTLEVTRNNESITLVGSIND